MLLLLQLSGCAGNIHGGTFFAMTGKDCVVLAADSRFSSQGSGSFLVGEFPRSVFHVGSRTLVAPFGLDSDARSLMDALREKFAGIFTELALEDGFECHLFMCWQFWNFRLPVCAAQSSIQSTPFRLNPRFLCYLGRTLTQILTSTQQTMLKKMSGPSLWRES